ncbi:MAG: DsrE family protein [Euryarchaeota archaeon]|nr:DsrE family protein [Euryarchaeota archaeon]
MATISQSHISRDLAGYLLGDDEAGAGGWPTPPPIVPRRVAVLLSTSRVGRVHRALRDGNEEVRRGRAVKMFVIGDGLELAGLRSPKYDIPGELQEFIDTDGRVYTCGTCIGLRTTDGRDGCILSSISDLVAIVRDADRVVVYD